VEIRLQDGRPHDHETYIVVLEYWSGAMLASEHTWATYTNNLPSWTNDHKVKRIQLYVRHVSHVLRDTIDVEARWFPWRERGPILFCTCAGQRCRGWHWVVYDRVTKEKVPHDVFYDRDRAVRQAEIYNRQGGPTE
jgi:hypothetical protein